MTWSVMICQSLPIAAMGGSRLRSSMMADVTDIPRSLGMHNRALAEGLYSEFILWPLDKALNPDFPVLCYFYGVLASRG